MLRVDWKWTLILTVLLSLALSACSGSVLKSGDGSNTPTPEGGDPGTPVSPGSADDSRAAPPEADVDVGGKNRRQKRFNGNHNSQSMLQAIQDAQSNSAAAERLTRMFLDHNIVSLDYDHMLEESHEVDYRNGASTALGYGSLEMVLEHHPVVGQVSTGQLVLYSEDLHPHRHGDFQIEYDLSQRSDNLYGKFDLVALYTYVNNRKVYLFYARGQLYNETKWKIDLYTFERKLPIIRITWYKN